MPYETQAARIYDLYCPEDRGTEARFWAGLAGSPPCRLLEPMVGTAGVALGLCRMGYSVTGVDLSPAMVAVAEEQRRAAPPEVAGRLTLMEGDICTVALPPGQFDLAYVAFGSWNLLTDAELRLQALRAIRKALAPGGRCALELFPPLEGSGRTEPRTFKPLRPTPPGMTVAKTSYLESDAEAQIMQIHERLHVNGEESEHHLMMRMLTLEQAAAEMQEAGFAAVTVHGPEPHSVPTSDTLLVVGTV